MGSQRVGHDLATKQQCIHTLMYMWGCTRVCDREREEKLRSKGQLPREIWSLYHQLTNGNWGCAWEEDEIFWVDEAFLQLQLFGCRVCSMWIFPLHACGLETFKSVLMLPASALSKSDPGSAGYLNDLFTHLKLFYPKAWHAICNSKVFSPAIKLDFASQEKKEKELDFLKNQHVGWPWSKL